MNKLLFLLLAVPIVAVAQPKNFKPANAEAFKTVFSAESKKISSIKSDFVQEKTLTMLTEKIVSKGDFWFKRNDKVKIEYKTPHSYIMIINGDQMISKDGEKVSRINVSANKMLRQLNKIIVDCVQGTILYNKNFSSNVFEDGTTWWLELTPLNKTISDFFHTINIQIEKKDYSVSLIELVESGGDKTVMQFSNKQINSTIPDEVFTLH